MTVKCMSEDLFDDFYDRPGTIPGTLNIEWDATPSEIYLIDYNESKLIPLKNIPPQMCAEHLDTHSVSWVDVRGLGSEKILQGLGEVFSLHSLVLEDVVNVPQRPKVEDYKEHLVIIARMVIPLKNNEGFHTEQVSFILGQHYLLSIQEEPKLDCFDSVRDRIRHHKGTIRSHGPDYLAYALWDAIIDGFFPVLEAYGERIEELEDEVVLNPNEKTLAKIYQVKRELLGLRRAIWPQRDAISILIRDKSSLINEDVFVYFRDCYDHTVQIIDIIEIYRELASGLMDVYLSAVSNKMNEIMKLLTVISTIFIPLTFIVGVYGMNFNSQASPFNMPELNWYWGYVACWGLMIVIAGSLILFFWRRGWFKNVTKVKQQKK
ncbi:MAG: magnesium/cobalt transporter CorA [Cyanobacteria bacterium P01_A01_bin.84]